MDESAQDSKLTRVTDDPLSKSSVPDNKKEWVKFDDEENVKSDVQNEKVNRNNACCLHKLSWNLKFSMTE